MKVTHAHAPGAAARAGAPERGAVLVELAIVSLFLLTLFAGTYDYGLAWRTGLTANEAARTGARVGSARGPQLDADYSALSGVKAALTSSETIDDVERVVIFKASGTDGDVPDACKAGTGGPCQVIDGDSFRTTWDEADTFADVTDSNGCLDISSVKGYCPRGRVIVQQNAEYYGVWVKLRHDFEFSLLGDHADVSRTAVMRLEPKVE